MYVVYNLVFIQQTYFPVCTFTSSVKCSVHEIVNVFLIGSHCNRISALLDDTMGLLIQPSLITGEGYNTSPYCKLFS